MLKNLNDTLTLFTLIFFTVMTIRLSVGVFTSAGKEKGDISFWEYLKNYRDNEED